MNILIKTIIVILFVVAMCHACMMGLDKEAHRQEVVNRDICVKYELECRG